MMNYNYSYNAINPSTTTTTTTTTSEEAEMLWIQRLRELENFHRRYGHCDPSSEQLPDNDNDNDDEKHSHSHSELANWVIHQRNRFRGFSGLDPLTRDQMDMLKPMNFFSWLGNPVKMMTKTNDQENENENHKDNAATATAAAPAAANPSINKVAGLSDPSSTKPLVNNNKIAAKPKPKPKSKPKPKPISEAEMKRSAAEIALWMESFRELQVFHEKYGHCDLSKEESLGGDYEYDYDYSDLERWVMHQRNRYRGFSGLDPLTTEQTDLLKSINFFSWLSDPLKDGVWHEQFQQLSRYKESKGDCEVSPSTDPELGNFVRKQRYLYNIANMLPDRKKLLDSIGFEWLEAGGKRQRRLAEEQQWADMFELIKQYKIEHGDYFVPRRYDNDLGLGLGPWVQSQRTLHKRGGLNKERTAKLEEIGFVWQVRKPVADCPERAWADMFGWAEMFERVKLYKMEHGNCLVPKTYSKDVELGKWVSRQRRLHTTKKLSQEQITKLEEIGFVWRQARKSLAKKSIHEYPAKKSALRWKEKLERLKQYKIEHGDCLVPRNYESDMELGSWVGSQRKFHRTGKLNKERLAKLKELGFVWHVGAGRPRIRSSSSRSNSTAKEKPFLQQRDRGWAGMLHRIKQYKTEHGDYLVPAKYDKDPELGSWVSSQRKAHKTGKISKERTAKLEEIGFEWHVGAGRQCNGRNSNSTRKNRERRWPDKFERIKQFKRDHGDCLVPRNYENDIELGNWVSSQRKAHRTGKISKERIAKLEEIGFVWHVGAGRPRIIRNSNEQTKRIVMQLELERRWTENLERIKQYKQKHGDCWVPRAYGDAVELGYWAHRQRTAHRSGKLSEERTTKLEEIGFTWQARTRKV